MKEIDKMDKKNLIEKVIMIFQEKAEETKKSFELARQEVIAAPSAMQSKSDTTKFQMSRLAENLFNTYQQIQRCVSSLREIDMSKEYKAIKIGALVNIEENKSKSYYFILPSDCGNQIIELERQEVNTIAVRSPIAQALLNKKVGETVNVRVPAGIRTFRIIEIE